MSVTDFDTAMKELEVHNQDRVPAGEWFAIRIDGRSFSALTEKHFQKPCDDLFFGLMDKVVETVVEEFSCPFAYTQSDEASFLFGPGFETFGRRSEKLTTVIASLAGSTFSRAFIEPVTFDARMVKLGDPTTVQRYFHWRAIDGFRNAISTALYWKLRLETNASAASKTLAGMSQLDRARAFGGTNAVQTLPDRFKYGKNYFWNEYDHVGFNPLTKETVPTKRRRITSSYAGMSTGQNHVLAKAMGVEL